MIPYTEVQINIPPDWNEIMMAELGEIGYDSFVETDNLLLAYIPQEFFDLSKSQAVIETHADKIPVSFTYLHLETINWNKEWESNYPPIEVAERVRVRASFHAPGVGFEHEIIIDPKMSFGTGHHETTSMMIEQQLAIDHTQKSVLDVGSGTGILAILAHKLGATEVLGFDIEDWAYINALENVETNHCIGVEMFQGTIEDCPAKQYDIVLANINRNILLQQIPTYVQFMKPESVLLVSGFYAHDVADITQKAADCGLVLEQQLTQNQWASVRFARRS
jgi:ribosomal protein L11 methyltransferase